ncbi:hypothetical protein KI387_026573, partial [Taxus chinensis]
MVDMAGVIDVADVAVIVGIEHSCEMTRGKVEVGSMELDGADSELGTRVGGIDMCI